MRRAGATPLVLAGDGAAALGVVAGVAAERLIWLATEDTPLAALLGWQLEGLAPRTLAEEAVMAGEHPGWLHRTRGRLAVHWDAGAREAGGWLRAAAATGELAAVTVAGYDPALDEDGGMLARVLDTLRHELG